MHLRTCSVHPGSHNSGHPLRHFAWRIVPAKRYVEIVDPLDVVRAVRVLRMPREFGFVQGEVSGGSGYGAATVRGRRYRRSLERPCIVSVRAVPRLCRPRAVRDFRGALVGRARRGLFVTTGTFTTEAKRGRPDGTAQRPSTAWTGINWRTSSRSGGWVFERNWSRAWKSTPTGFRVSSRRGTSPVGA